MERSRFDAFTADDARVKATEETDDSRRAEWWKLAAALDVRSGRTAGDLPEELRDCLFETTGAATADITIELLARTLKEPEPTDVHPTPGAAHEDQKGGRRAPEDPE